MRTAVAAAALVVCLIVAVSGLSYKAADHPPVMGRNAAASAGHPLTTAAAFETLLKGGNAFDAGVAAMLVGGVVEQDLTALAAKAWCSCIRAAAARSFPWSVKAGRRKRQPSIGMSRGARRWRGSASTPRSFRARCTRR